MNISAIMLMVVPSVALGIMIASTVFASIVRHNNKLRTSLAYGSKSARELLYDYIAEEERCPVQRRGKISDKRSAQLYSFNRERRLRAN